MRDDTKFYLLQSHVPMCQYLFQQRRNTKFNFWSSRIHCLGQSYIPLDYSSMDIMQQLASMSVISYVKNDYQTTHFSYEFRFFHHNSCSIKIDITLVWPIT